MLQCREICLPEKFLTLSTKYSRLSLAFLLLSCIFNRSQNTSSAHQHYSTHKHRQCAWKKTGTKKCEWYTGACRHVHVLRTDVLPTSPQALLPSRFIAATSITTNIGCSDIDLLVWFDSTPNQYTSKWFLIIVTVTHEEVSWLERIGIALIKS